MSKTIKQYIIVILGLLVCGCGVGLFLFANLGVDPASVFLTGLSKVFGFSYGTASMLMNFTFLIILFFIDRHYVRIASVLAIFLIGYGAEFVSNLLRMLFPHPIPLWIGIVIVLVGIFLMSLGIVLYILADLGVGSVDAISEVISDKTHFDYQKVRIGADLTFLLVGIMLGGSLGFATVMISLLTGPCVQWIRRQLKPKVESILQNS